MALQLNSFLKPSYVCEKPKLPQFSCRPVENLDQIRHGCAVTCCSSSASKPRQPASSAEAYLNSKAPKLEIGSPIIVTEAPKWLKTATSMPSLRVNSGQVNQGDVGRIMSMKPKDVWAVRFSIGTYLIDGKYFKALVIEEPE